jgi:hypothetical protein
MAQGALGPSSHPIASAVTFHFPSGFQSWVCQAREGDWDVLLYPQADLNTNPPVIHFLFVLEDGLLLPPAFSFWDGIL